VQFEKAAAQELITDETEIKKAKAGPDVHCGFCGTRNPAGTKVCTQCGADLTQGSQRQIGQVVSAYQSKPAQQVACPNCGAQNPETAFKCAACGASLRRAPEPAAAPQPQAVKTAGSPLAKYAIWLVLGVIVLCAFAGIVMLTRPAEAQTGVVERVNWATLVMVEALRPATYETWREEIPADAEIGNCTQEVHHVQDEPAENANKICGTPYEVDTGSGFAEVVQDCRYEVLEDWCQFTVMEWQNVEEARLEGTDFSPRWAEPQLQDDQRLGEQGVTYTVILRTTEDTYTYTPADLEQFRQFQIGSEWIVNTNALGGIVSIEPAP
jgi:DNA-directed RNA polymerase subunit RPC12/RpoP